MLPEHIRHKTRLFRRQIFEYNRFAATLGACAISSFVPPRFDPRITAVILDIYCRIKPRRIRRSAEKKISLHRTEKHPLSPEEARKIAVDYHLMRVEIRWSQARALGLRPSIPATTIKGLHHLDDALLKGNGVILWRMSFTGATPLNAALHQRGHHIVHLSAPEHLGTTLSKFSTNVVVPLMSFDEARFLKKRVIAPRGRATGYLGQLKETLNENGIVSMVGDIGRGRISTEVQSGNATIKVPSGAPSLARATGAALLPCVAVRVAPFSYKVIIMPNAAPDRHLDKLAFRELAIQQYAKERSAILEAFPSSAAYY